MDILNADQEKLIKLNLNNTSRDSESVKSFSAKEEWSRGKKIGTKLARLRFKILLNK